MTTATQSTVTANLEKIFMNWILKNPEHFKIVQGYYFEHEDIQFIYNCIRNEYLGSNDKDVPGLNEIINLVKIKDIDDKISIDLIKTILKVNFNDYREEFIIPRFNAWVLSNSTINGVIDSIEVIKGIDKTDFKAVKIAVDKVKTNIDDATNIALDKGNVGIDFDDPDAHDQETAKNKISWGYQTLDTITDGGFDRKTLTVIMGETGNGKSLWAQNIAVNVANAGYNVAYITLELSEKKCLKRIGSMRLEIPIKEYNELAKDREYMKERIQMINKRNNKSSLFDESTTNGKLLIKEYPSGSATISDVEQYIKLVYEKLKINIDFLVVDYIQIMGCEKGVDRNMLYLKGEHLAVGLRALAQKYNLACLTMTQIDKSKYGANMIALNGMPESKAIADTADGVWALVRTALMKIDKIYHFLPLKLRDNETDYDRIRFEYSSVFLRIIPGKDSFVERI